MSSCNVPFTDLGLVSATYMNARNHTGNYDRSQMLKTRAEGVDKARAMALAKLRTEAKKKGANAVYAVHFDVEDAQWYRICVATGAAVLIQGLQKQQPQLLQYAQQQQQQRVPLINKQNIGEVPLTTS